MVLIHCRRSFFCLSVSFGVFIGANFGLAGGVLVSAISWMQIALLTRHPLPTQDRISLYIQAIVYTLLAIISSIGMLGSILRRLKIIYFYQAILSVHLIVSFASGGFSFFSFFRSGSDDVKRCINGSVNELTKELCGKGWSVIRAGTVGLFIFLWLIQIYTLILADNLSEAPYTDDVSEHAFSKEAMMKNISSPIPISNTNSYMGGVMFGFVSESEDDPEKLEFPHSYDIRPERSFSHFSDP